MSPPVVPLVPVPSSVRMLPGGFALSPHSRILGGGDAAALLREDIARRTGLTLSQAEGDPRPGDIALTIGTTSATPGPAEGYRLQTTDHALVTGADEAGLFYGTRTLLQLLAQDDDGWRLRDADIVDAPRFAYRGAMLDVVRHFAPVSLVRSFIDRISDLKLNHLHLHLTDDQGWRVHIESWPKLTALAAGTSVAGQGGGFYSAEDYRELVAYAQRRHVTLVPEIDLPGHTHAIGVAYPDLVEEPVLGDVLQDQARALGQPLPQKGVPYTGWGVGHSSVRIREERTYEFIRDVLTEVAALTPGPYLHIGGDECLATPPEDFAVFIERVTAIVRDLGKTPITWHEAGAAPSIARGTIGQYWGQTVPQGAHAAHARRFVERGGALILSPSDAAYLDMKYTADFPLGLDWAGTVDVRTSYQWDPAEVLGLPEGAVLGVEAPLWTETVSTLAEIDTLTFPRIAAQAEIGWSPRADPARTWTSFQQRVAALSEGWEAAGITFHRSPEIAWSGR